MLDLISKFAVKQTGGAATRATLGTTFTVLLIALLVLFIKVFLVHWSYNEVIPNLFNEKYRKITMVEALFLVILVQSLFN